MKGVLVQAGAQPKKSPGRTSGAWVAAVLGVLLLAAGVTAIWADTSKRDDNGYFSANAHPYQTQTGAIPPESITVGSDVPPCRTEKVEVESPDNNGGCGII